MTKNPMQRKAQNSFLLGMLSTLFITGIIIAFLIFMLTKMQKETKVLKDGQVTICALKQEVMSGQVITDDMVTTLRVNKNMVPSNSFGSNVSIIETYRLEDTKGNSLINNENGQLCALYYDQQGNAVKDSSGNPQYKPVETADGINYYYTDTGERVELKTLPIIAKIDMAPNTILTSSLIVRSSEKITNDVRRAEYNMILLPSQLETGKYVDVRLRLPSGADYIVVSHKEVEIPNIGGVDSVSTISMNLSEMEILTLGEAIVEAYQIEGAKLYAIEYVDPGIQDRAVTTFVPSNETLRLIQTNPNCVNEARQGLWNRLYEKNSNGEYVIKKETSDNRGVIDKNLNENSEAGKENLKTQVEKEIQAMQEERQKYLESLGATY